MTKPIVDPNLVAALSALSPKVRRALVASHEALDRAGVPHALVGGIAVGAYGFVRATKDVDWLVGDQAFHHHGKLVTMREGLPYQYDGISIDYLSPLAGTGEAQALFVGAPGSAPAVAPVEQIFRQKLHAGRARDVGDLVELLKRGVPLAPVRAYLGRVAPSLLPALDRVAKMAASESD
jgi:hypothetical protein